VYKHLGVALLVTGLSLLAGPAVAQTEPPAKARRTVYVVKHGAAKDLAALLGKHFKGDADVQVLPDAPSNCLLISAPPALFEEVVKALEALDRRPHQVSVEVLVAEAAPRKAGGEKPGSGDKELDESQFSGPAEQVLDRVELLLKKGQLESLKRIQLTALENQQASVHVGDSKPVVMGTTRTGTGLVARSIVYRNVGAVVRLTPRLTAEKLVHLDLTVEDARVAYPEDGAEVGQDENGKPVRAADFITARLDTRVDVPPGQALAAKGVQTTSKSGQAQTLVIVTARVLDPDADSKK
jgi:type II secretory pathway component GspD/PulD (secretin)